MAPVVPGSVKHLNRFLDAFDQHCQLKNDGCWDQGQTLTETERVVQALTTNAFNERILLVSCRTLKVKHCCTA